MPTSSTFTYSQPATLANAASGGGTISYSAPIATLGVNPSLTGVALNDETRKAILVDPFGASSGFVFNVLDQSSNVISFPSSVPGVGNVGAAVNPLGNLGVVVNENNKLAVVVDPAAAAVLAVIPVGTKPVDVAIDPATNLAAVVNQGDNSVSIFPLGALRTPQILAGQRLTRTFVSWVGGSRALVPDDPRLSRESDPDHRRNGPGQCHGASGRDAPRAGFGQRSGNDRHCARGHASEPAAVHAGCDGQRNAGGLECRKLCRHPERGLDQRQLPGSRAARRGHRSQHNVRSSPSPAARRGSRRSSICPPERVPWGRAPRWPWEPPTGVGILSQAGLAVVANQGSNNASIIDVVSGVVTNTVPTDAGPSGVAIDSGTGNALVTATNSNTLDVFSVQSPPASPTSIGVQQGPVAVAVDPTRELALVANGTSNNASVVSVGSSGVISTISGLSFPTGVVFDPISSNFLMTSSLQNQVLVVNVNTQSSSGIRVGINPTPWPTMPRLPRWSPRTASAKR